MRAKDQLLWSFQALPPEALLLAELLADIRDQFGAAVEVLDLLQQEVERLTDTLASGPGQTKDSNDAEIRD